MSEFSLPVRSNVRILHFDKPNRTNAAIRLAGQIVATFEEGPVTSTAPETWDRHGILAAIKRRYGSLTGLAERYKTDKRHLSVALHRPYPKAEQVIARALAVPARELWPDRFDAAGHRKRRQKAARPAQSQSKNSTSQTEALR
ncbi:MAG TPA: helix-turn-helix domain-containing protein [Devosia sp.]|jgi:Ner family transcriptional regulator|nr:helix-turn-helix domain-containing protein [Devosia sp.]